MTGPITDLNSWIRKGTPGAASEWAMQTYQRLMEKMRAQCLRVGTRIPYFPYNGHYGDCVMPGGLSWWTNGFWPGMLWQMYHATGEEPYRAAAEGVEARLDELLHTFDKLDHDIGFLFLPSSVADFHTTGNEAPKNRSMHAASLLAGRFNPSGNYIRAWDHSNWKEDVSGWMIIDCMMNIQLLYWASELSGDPRYADIADRHAHTALNTILRPDGSASHIAEFDAVTGGYLNSVGGQGYGEGSSWSRGQGWAVYGFALCFRRTGRHEYLNAAKHCAHYCISSLSVSEWLPLVDFRAPDQPVKYDSGAGAIIACGLLEIAEHVPELEKTLYEKAAENILQACEREFCDWNPETDGILGGGTTMYHDDRLANMSFIYGDYFFLEAILRLNGKSLQIF